MERITQALRLLGNETRLRILNLTSQASLNVSELTAILGVAQSGVSRNLSHLKQMGLLHETKERGWSYYQTVGPDELDDELRLLCSYLQEQLTTLDNPFHDDIRLQEILRQRDDSAPGLNERLLEPGQSWLTWSRALGFLVSRLDVADLGCGDGTITAEMARFASSVIGVDYQTKVLQLAQERVTRSHLNHVRLVQANIEGLPIRSESVDVAFFSQSLHHLREPEQGFREAARILRPGGRLIVMELASHQETWVQDKLGHIWLGFEKESLSQMMHAAGLRQIHVETNPKRREESFRVMLASAIK